MFAAGKRNERIRVERKQVTTDPTYRSDNIDWVPFVTLWAEVQDVLPSRAEADTSGIRIANRPSRIRTAYTPGITSAMRIVLLDRGERLLSIVSGPADLGRRQGMELMAEEFSTAGDGP